jgi:deoxycytidylate deaminase
MKHGAVIVRGGSVLSVGVNTGRNHPTVFDNSAEMSLFSSVHAESMALRIARRTVGATMYIARVNKQGVPRLSRPCNRCFIELLQAGIKEIVYTVN